LLYRLDVRDVRLSPDVAHAFSTLQSFRPDAAILDFGLGTETSEAVANDLLEIDVPLLLVTGFGHGVMIPDHLRHAPNVSKPASSASVLSQMARARRRLAQG